MKKLPANKSRAFEIAGRVASLTTAARRNEDVQTLVKQAPVRKNAKRSKAKTLPAGQSRVFDILDEITRLTAEARKEAAERRALKKLPLKTK